jgi:carboxylesterase
MGGILAVHLAQNRPSEVHGLALYAPTIKLDGWSMPWHSWILRLLRPKMIHWEFDLPEHEPYGIKDERLRAFVVNSMLSGDSSQAGVFSTPLRCFANFNALVSVVKKKLGSVTAPALIMHPRDDDIASFGNALYLQRKLGGLVDVVVMDDSYHIITLDRQRHLVVERSLTFASALEKEAIRRAAVARPLHRIAAE